MASSALSVTAWGAPCGGVRVGGAVAGADAAGGGGGDAEEVVQLYVATPDATVPAPQLRPAALARVGVPAGGSTRVSLSVPAEARAVLSAAGAAMAGDANYQAGGEMELQPGRIALHVGGGEPGFGAPTLEATVRVVGSTTKLAAC